MSPVDAIHLRGCALIAEVSNGLRSGFTKEITAEVDSLVVKVRDMLKLHDEMAG